jgi:hypothetical protein
VWKCISPSAGKGTTGTRFRRRPEIFGKSHLVVLVERLVAQQNNQMLVPGIEQFLLELLVNRIAQVDAENFRAERRRELPHREDGVFLVQRGGGCFH